MLCWLVAPAAGAMRAQPMSRLRSTQDLVGFVGGYCVSRRQGHRFGLRGSACGSEWMEKNGRIVVFSGGFGGGGDDEESPQEESRDLFVPVFAITAIIGYSLIILYDFFKQTDPLSR
mmetsp:Transcript_1113/g.2180  ORF Transcript_1113/g.2180 Transcript_1113/m.2180 type:complete len:117 (-) Transcript_1113:1209-1559(-)